MCEQACKNEIGFPIPPACYPNCLPWPEVEVARLRAKLSEIESEKQEETSMTKIERHAKICEELNKLYERKNHDYGDSFHQTFVEEGMAMPRIRLSDKLSRFKRLSSGSSQSVTDESIRDTLMDLANYAIMTILEMEEK